MECGDKICAAVYVTVDIVNFDFVSMFGVVDSQIGAKIDVNDIIATLSSLPLFNCLSRSLGAVPPKGVSYSLYTLHSSLLIYV